MIYRIAAHYNLVYKSWTDEYLISAHSEESAMKKIGSELALTSRTDSLPTLVLIEYFTANRLKQPYLISTRPRNEAISG